MDTYLTGGASVVVNTAPLGIAYVILKNIDGQTRQHQAMETAVNLTENSLRSTYFGADAALAEPFAVVHEQEE